MINAPENPPDIPTEQAESLRAPRALAKVIGKLHEGERVLMRQHEQKTSVLLRQSLNQIKSRTISLGELIVILEDRSFGLFMLFFALPGCIPGPPAITSVLGIPLIIFSFQIMMGHHRPWLPPFLANISLKRKYLFNMVHKARHPLKYLETLCRPRMEVVERGGIERLLGLLLLILSITLSIPLPGTNLVTSLAVAIIAIGMLEKDGFIILGGSIFGFIAEGIALTALHFDLKTIEGFYTSIFS
ncbi:MAG TPA: ABC transporter permease [Rhodospirillaceae bacterium]|nr:MAG: hypothetical protein A2018_06380 [Alphaproteobacteria bacterium GWF2_58_20]HAU29141.1 ABC transporter permease [Rhodospirillaceae bacterium]